MTKSVNDLRNSILTSIHGRKLGWDANDFLVGPKSLKVATQFIGSCTNSSVSSTGTAVISYGVTSFAIATEAATTGSSYGTAELHGSFALDAPAEGVDKLLYTASQMSTMLINVFCSTGVTIIATHGSTFGGVQFNGPGQYIQLQGVSTSKWLLKAMGSGSSLGAT